MSDGHEDLVTRAQLSHWGFVRLPDVWLSCPSEGRHNYFERWYHAEWNYTAILGWPGQCPLRLRPEDFLARVQLHMCEGEDLQGGFSWDDSLSETAEPRRFAPHA